MKPVSFALSNRRLLKLADYVERRHRAKPKNGYDQGIVAHPCGAPACLMGHARAVFKISGHIYVGDFLGLVGHEFAELLAFDGCGSAGRNWRKAVKYVRDFVARRKANAPT